MTAAVLALVPDTDATCPVCSGNPNASFVVVPWGFHQARSVRCPLCLPGPRTAEAWRRVLGPFLGEVP